MGVEAAARNFLVATAFLAPALRLLVRAAFRPAALNFRVFAALLAIALMPPGRDLMVAMAFEAAALRFLVWAAFFAAKLCFVGIDVPFVYVGCE
jgi:hypothetical protein